MSGLTELLQALSERGVRLRVEADQLRVRAPKGVVDAALRAQLDEHKAGLIAFLEREAAAAALPQAVADPAGRFEPFALTDIQEAYWIGASAGLEGAGGYHYYLEFDCPGLHIGRLELAWRALIARHDMLRAVILPDGRQRVLEQVPPYALEVHDFSADAEGLAALRRRLAQRTPELGRWPLSQVQVSRLAGGRCRVHVSLGLITLDSFSMVILFDEWQRLYLDPCHPLPPLPTSFRDYVLAERQLRHTAAYRQAERHWQQRLADLPPAPDLPTATPGGSSHAEGRFFRLTQALDAPCWARLKQRATDFGLTPSALLLTAFCEVLATWSASPRFTLNLTLFNRLPLGEAVERIVGDFTSVTLLAVDFSRRRPFVEHAAAMSRQLREGLEHRAYPGVQVLRDWARQLGSSGRALAPVVFSSTLVLDTAADFSMTRLFGGELCEAISQTPQCHFDHQLMEDQGRLVFHWDLLEGLYPEGMPQDMFAAYCALLQHLAAGDEAFTEIRAALVPAHQAQRHAAMNATDTPLPAGTLAQLFVAQVARRGEAPAVITRQRRLSFRALERRARRVAHWLRDQGLAREQAVAIVMNKGWEQVVAVLGTLMAGGAYMPVDAAAPAAHRAQLLRREGVQHVLTQSALCAEIRGDAAAGAALLSVDAMPDDDSAPLPAVGSPGDLAYILHTSGSTGRPKGVMIEQGAVVQRMLEVVQRFGLGPEDRAFGLSALHHDLSVFDLFGVLCGAGGALVLPDAQCVREPEHWLALMAREGVTLWNSVPAFMSMLVDHLETARGDGPAPGLRWCILSGDFIPVSLPTRARALMPGLQCVSAGGPTETTVWDICHPIEAVDPGWASIPYGRPMANARYFVLKADLQPCPDWTPGELFIAGRGLARGYWHDEAATAAQFIVHPESGERLYRSGDLGRHRPDGTIDILGRVDFQVKLQGQRIELGEIEAALERLPQVAQAVVTVQGAPRDPNAQLVAHVVLAGQDVPVSATGGAGLSAEALDFKLRQTALLQPAAGQARISLPPAPLDPAPFLARQSQRRFLSEAIPLADLSALLAGLRLLPVEGAPLPKRLYPSGGSLYPVQTWLHVKPGRVQGLEAGFYYHDPQAHALLAFGEPATGLRLYHGINAALLEASGFVVLLVGCLDAVEPLYPGAARDFCLLEAGHMAQLLMQLAAPQRIGLCPLGQGVDETGLRAACGLGPRHLLAYALAGGRIQAEWTQRWMAYAPPQGVAEAWFEPLRRALGEQLPAHRVPALYRRWDALPLTPNGKLDRGALAQAPARVERSVPGPVEAAPADPNEARLAALLAELLGVAGVAVHVPFFDLGASSVTLVQLRNRVQQEWGLRIPMAEFFGRGTVHLLARFLGEPHPAAHAALPAPGAQAAAAAPARREAVPL